VLLGKPMHFWRNQMPQNMFIRTNPLYISLSDPEDRWTIHRYSAETGTALASPFPRPAFVDYAFWFARHNGVEFTPELAIGIDRSEDGFAVTTESGQSIQAAHVIIATGLQHFAHIPAELQSLPSSLLTHTYGQTSFERFRGQTVAVIGSGQSAWEAAALLHQAGCDTELLFRREAVHYASEDNTASGQRLIETAEQFYRWPLEQKLERWNTPRRGSVAPFLKPYVEGKVRTTGGVSIVKAEATADGKVHLDLSNGDSRTVDHVVSATGYHIDLDLLPFISAALKEAIVREPEPFNRFPLLSEHFESSVPGLYFTSALASHTHGPAFGFIAGLRQACRSIVPRIAESKAGIKG
jgi:lysine/ornithine N-monooxygenase